MNTTQYIITLNRAAEFENMNQRIQVLFLKRDGLYIYYWVDYYGKDQNGLVKIFFS